MGDCSSSGRLVTYRATDLVIWEPGFSLLEKGVTNMQREKMRINFVVLDGNLRYRGELIIFNRDRYGNTDVNVRMDRQTDRQKYSLVPSTKRTSEQQNSNTKENTSSPGLGF